MFWFLFLNSTKENFKSLYSTVSFLFFFLQIFHPPRKSMYILYLTIQICLKKSTEFEEWKFVSSHRGKIRYHRIQRQFIGFWHDQNYSKSSDYLDLARICLVLAPKISLFRKLLNFEKIRKVSNTRRTFKWPQISCRILKSFLSTP